MSVVFTGGQTITMDGREPTDTPVTIDRDRIVAVGAEARADATVVDLGGRTLIPGMLDLHTHMGGGDNAIGHGDEATTFRMSEPLIKAVIDSVEAAGVTLRSGFTTVREIGSRDYIDVYLREAQRRGQIEAPRILATGPGIAMTGGHGSHWDPTRTADGVDGIVRRVRELVHNRVDIIKVVSADGPETLGKWWTVQSTPEELNAAFAEARRLGRRTAAHAMGGEAIGNVARAGVDTVEHGWYLTEESCQLMKEHGTCLVPTIGNFVDIITFGPTLEMPWAVMMADDEDAVFDRLRMAIEIGVQIVCGSDCGGNESHRHGRNAMELECYVRCGMSPHEALETATIAAARAMKLDDNVGSIEAGKYADFAVINGDPLSDVSLLRTDVVGVVQGGRVIRDDLGLMNELRLLYPPSTVTTTAIVPGGMSVEKHDYRPLAFRRGSQVPIDRALPSPVRAPERAAARR
jgi:imidazolonepropionase-like amidohydrolase